MKFALLGWTVICAGIVIFEFFTAPAWDTETESFEVFSGRDAFTFVALLTPIVWIVGILLIFVIDELIDAVRRRVR